MALPRATPRDADADQKLAEHKLAEQK